MSTEMNSFSARLLETGALAFGGFAAAALLEKEPGIEERFGAGALANWKTNLTQRVRELAAAVECGDPGLFQTQVLWSRRAFSGRARDVSDLEASLLVLRDVLAERLPEAAREAPLAFIDGALESLTSETGFGGSSALDPKDPHQRMALEYLERVLDGDSRGAISALARAREDGASPVELVSKVLMPAEREIGRLWHVGRSSISEEHMVTAATREALAVIAFSSERAPANGKTAVAAAVAGNAHDVGLQAASTVFELAGWRTVCLGGDVPAEELPRALRRFDADLLLLSAMLSVQLGETRRSIEIVRSQTASDVRILVGGSVFDSSHDLWRTVGADGYAASIESAVAEGSRLVGL